MASAQLTMMVDRSASSYLHWSLPALAHHHLCGNTEEAKGEKDALTSHEMEGKSLS